MPLRRVLLTILLLANLTPRAGRAQPDYELETGRELGLTAAGAVLLGLGYRADRDARPLIPEEIHALDPSRVPAFDRGATEQWSPQAARVSNVTVGLCLAAPLGLMATDGGQDNAGRLGVMYGQTLLLTGGAVYLLKSVTERTRPFVYNDDPAIPLEEKMTVGARRSFPSGHTANAFAGAVFLGTVHDRLYPDSGARTWVWAGGLGLATTTGLLRYQAGKHYPTDILAGAAIGVLCGWLVPRLHEVDAPSGALAAEAPMLSYGFRF